MFSYIGRNYELCYQSVVLSELPDPQVVFPLSCSLFSSSDMIRMTHDLYSDLLEIYKLVYCLRKQRMLGQVICRQITLPCLEVSDIKEKNFVTCVYYFIRS